ncbi:sugar transferase [Halomonas sp. EGI 63088]|uniref:Sugar transferase n=1 Tax=Halomonas flagellata TaxID=2920385 RepID=A0ABS9RS90_9GAMM|nr:sugar transferase [Halomonas flagellata]MCH4562704.1 sugar transferase [Halomonas flagellata]
MFAGLERWSLDRADRVNMVSRGFESYFAPRHPHQCIWHTNGIDLLFVEAVEQGYAAEVDGMSKKLQYDFYYIKHFSLWLDVLISLKTVRILFTGFGAR